MEYKAALEALGLKDSEISTYVALLFRGPSSIRKVGAATGINRGTTYEAMKRLVSLGLVRSFAKSKRKSYFAENPGRLFVLAEEKEKEITRAVHELKELVPRLLSSAPHRLGEPIVRYYEDDEGIVAILRDVLSTAATLVPKEYYVYSSRPLRQYLYRRFPNFTRRRVREGIKVKVIAIGEGGDPTAELYERRFLPEPPGNHFTSYVIIYGHKMALISVSPNKTPYGVVIEEPGVAATQKYLFQSLWDSLK